MQPLKKNGRPAYFELGERLGDSCGASLFLIVNGSSEKERNEEWRPLAIHAVVSEAFEKECDAFREPQPAKVAEERRERMLLPGERNSRTNAFRTD